MHYSWKPSHNKLLIAKTIQMCHTKSLGRLLDSDWFISCFISLHYHCKSITPYSYLTETYQSCSTGRWSWQSDVLRIIPCHTMIKYYRPQCLFHEHFHLLKGIPCRIKTIYSCSSTSHAIFQSFSSQKKQLSEILKQMMK